ncbi:bifunctional diaminohydroxyphosphoribosylaminopyrimidine deaminase/5-amino-6-(5-phosphoribosylamino)uracil reductase RibD, partial [Crocinitomicaceae bacterium]|nr:bifunctional diaminohydroxyphosphoribosylaminopyrimidine deaminase/5-amino-6-(5-phosphoribosylamino)uracil reductase RibD [Crocinitomicaceae bacterium]
MITDEQYMKRCIQLASMGKGNVAPNPLVGALIVIGNRVIGEGYHQKFGEAHAEVNAIDSVEDKTILSQSTLYVSLEPCAHFGKTPPCADLILKYNFKRVVIGCTDTFKQVSGKGINQLKNAGIDVQVGVLEKECRELNKHFFTFQEKNRPFVFLKWAQTAQGFIDNGQINETNKRAIAWISKPEARTITHQWRAEHQAILVGKNTIKNDNPRLTVREVEGNHPIRIILDTKATLRSIKCTEEEGTTIVLNTVKDEK